MLRFIQRAPGDSHETSIVNESSAATPFSDVRSNAVHRFHQLLSNGISRKDIPFHDYQPNLICQILC